jgi:hypothetical protein
VTSQPAGNKREKMGKNENQRKKTEEKQRESREINLVPR